jgi:SMODS-associating 2TM, beta-strand rich effector domain
MGRFYPYATDSAERDTLAYWFAGIALGLGYLISLVIVHYKISVPWWVDSPSPIVLYFILRGWFARFLWRLGVFHTLRIVRIPDLNGTYRGHFSTSYDEQAKWSRCELKITQTWTTISILADFEESRSFNEVTGISVEGTAAPRLTYEYWNEPKATSTQSMNPHRGTIWFDIIDGDTLRLRGEYYTGRGRGTVGSIEVARIKNPNGNRGRS